MGIKYGKFSSLADGAFPHRRADVLHSSQRRPYAQYLMQALYVGSLWLGGVHSVQVSRAVRAKSHAMTFYVPSDDRMCPVENGAEKRSLWGPLYNWTIDFPHIFVFQSRDTGIIHPGRGPQLSQLGDPSVAERCIYFSVSLSKLLQIRLLGL